MFEKKLEAKWNGDGTVTISGNCVFSKKPHSITVNADEFKTHKDNPDMHIQHAMPSTSADDREFLISGISPQGFDAAFGEER
jgi:hypothetical protein